MARLHTPTSSASTQGTVPPARNGDSPVLARVARVIDLIRPTIQADGGDVELVGITSEQVVQIRLHGACVGCPSAAATLQLGIERNLKEHVPEVKGLRAVD